jgi:glycosyltransferase involved in cell wall biosynthesis
MGKIPVLYVITKLELGGAQKQLLSLIRGLDTEKFSPFLFTGFDGPLLTDALGFSYLTLKRSRCLTRPVHPLKDILAFWELFFYIKRIKARIVHTHSSKAGIIGRWAAFCANVPVVVHTVHGWSFNDFQPFFLRWGYLWLERIAARISDSIVTVSEHDKAKGIACGVGCVQQYALIHYGIEEVFFKAQGFLVREEFKVPPGNLVVGMIACFKPQKSPEDFIRLAALIAPVEPNVTFLLVGDGALRAVVVKRIRGQNLEGRVFLAGWRRDIPACIAAMDIVVLTSLWEGMPIVILEAMACAKPVVATHTGGIAEIVQEGETGFLVRPRDVQAMSAKVRLLLADGFLRERMGESAQRALGNDFCADKMAKDTARVYRALENAKSH